MTGLRFGMDFGGTNLKAGVFDEEGHTVSFAKKPLHAFHGSVNILQNLLAFAEEVIGDRSLAAGGIAAKGLVDSEHGLVHEDIGAGSLLAGIPLSRKFSEHFGVPFAVDNDARAYAWGEWLFGAGRGAETLVCMTIGTGLGCTVVAHGTPYCGTDQYGGLLGGHLSIDRNGPVCPCGQRGCLELYCSATALHHRVMAAHPDLRAGSADVLEAFFAEVRRHRRDCEATCQAFLEDLATGIVNLVHAYNPDVVVLGGGVLKSADVLLSPLRAMVHERAWTFPRAKVQLRESVLGDAAAAVGIAFHQHLEHL